MVTHPEKERKYQIWLQVLGEYCVESDPVLKEQFEKLADEIGAHINSPNPPNTTIRTRQISDHLWLNAKKSSFQKLLARRLFHQNSNPI